MKSPRSSCSLWRIGETETAAFGSWPARLVGVDGCCCCLRVSLVHGYGCGVSWSLECVCVCARLPDLYTQRCSSDASTMMKLACTIYDGIVGRHFGQTGPPVHRAVSRPLSASRCVRRCFERSLHRPGMVRGKLALRHQSIRSQSQHAHQSRPRRRVLTQVRRLSVGSCVRACVHACVCAIERECNACLYVCVVSAHGHTYVGDVVARPD